ncbi:uncharacterized protein LOC131398865 isoform X2 [Diceros bicornis minor]|uniref:uncharacterized protein LOC131398865 isoform X2 n=1 Tax=Diceros bicornis minor TaxID=77932 RepID=UPI0026EB1C0C|nr:uncharacterized protein LOC131398865 isoform X2 [Diceros bicornis minor]
MWTQSWGVAMLGDTPPVPQELFRKVVPSQCLGSTWGKRNKPSNEHLAHTVRATIDHFRRVASLVVTTCLGDPSMMAQDRECKILKNFSSPCTVISVLQKTSICHLKNTWGKFPGGALHVCSPREQPPESAGEAAAAAGIPSHEGDPAAPGGCKELQARARGSDLGPRSRTWSCSMRMRATPCPASQSARPSWPAEYARPRRTGHHQGQGPQAPTPNPIPVADHSPILSSGDTAGMLAMHRVSSSHLMGRGAL